jgi:hypothetical protein
VFGVLVDRARVVEVTSIVSTVWGLVSRFNLDIILQVARRYMSCVPQAKRHAGWRNRGPARALGTFTDPDCVGEHVFDAIKPRDQVARSGWVGFHQQVDSSPLVRGDRVALDDEIGSMEPKKMSTGLARKSAMLSRKMMSLEEAIELHEQP